MLPKSAQTADLLEVSDARAIRALAHPVRLTILERLHDDATVNATECARVTGESPQACSYHLRALAKWGFVRRAEADDGRETRWGAAARGFRFRSPERASAELDAAASVLRSYVVERDERALDAYFAGERDVDREWVDASFFASATAHVTAEELTEAEHEIQRLLAKYRRPPAERPAGSRRVHFIARAFPRLDEERKETEDE